MAPGSIYHLALAADWGANEEDYRGSTIGQSLAEVGYVHCATATQVQEVADLFYGGRGAAARCCRLLNSASTHWP